MDTERHFWVLVCMIGYCSVVFTLALAFYCIKGRMPFSEPLMDGVRRDRGDAPAGVQLVAGYGEHVAVQPPGTVGGSAGVRGGTGGTSALGHAVSSRPQSQELGPPKRGLPHARGETV